VFKRSHRRLERQEEEAARRVNELELRLAQAEARGRSLEELLAGAIADGLELAIARAVRRQIAQHLHPHGGRGEPIEGEHGPRRVQRVT